jgi:hypothetical protein
MNSKNNAAIVVFFIGLILIVLSLFLSEDKAIYYLCIRFIQNLKKSTPVLNIVFLQFTESC